MTTIIPRDVVGKLEEKLPPRGKILLAERLKITPSAVYMMFNGVRKMKKKYFDEAVKMIDEYKQYEEHLKKVLQEV